MAQKTNIRSIRFSDELADLIDRQAGRTFTEKFENLVTRCVWELPQKEKQLQKITEAIQAEQTKLIEMKKKSTNIRMTLHMLEMEILKLDGAIKTAINNVTQ